MSRYLRNIQLAKDQTGFMYYCPGCEENHVVATAGGGGPIWTFNGDMDHPEFSPSVLITYGDSVCHHFVKLGRSLGEGYVADLPYIQFCADSTHALSGQTVLLPDMPSHDG